VMLLTKVDSENFVRALLGQLFSFLRRCLGKV